MISGLVIEKVVGLPKRIHLKRIVQWQNDKSLRHLFIWSPNEAKYNEFATLRSVEDGYLCVNPDIHQYLIFVEGNLVGEMSFELNAAPVVRKLPGTAWVGIVIGDKNAQRLGIGSTALKYLEERIGEAGATRIELGTFEYNAAARRFYAKLGYKQFATIPEHTWWDGRFWDDIRFEKYLS